MQYLTRKISEYRYKTQVPKYRNRRPRHQIPSSETKGPEANTSRRTEPVERLIELEQFRRIRTSGSALVSLVISEIWVFYFYLYNRKACRQIVSAWEWSWKNKRKPRPLLIISLFKNTTVFVPFRFVRHLTKLIRSTILSLFLIFIRNSIFMGLNINFIYEN